MDQMIENMIKTQGSLQMEEVSLLLRKWQERGDNQVAGMFLLLGVALRGMKIMSETANYTKEELWVRLKEEMETLWNMSSDEMAAYSSQ